MATDSVNPGFAPAKINLTLHVTGQRADGYHLLDSLVVFADIGDRVSADPADDLTLEISGPHRAGVPVDGGNLVLRAAGLLRAGRGARLRLDKQMPVASGIGGGSADAAASLRVLARLWDCALPAAEAVMGLGADVPVCLTSRPTRMRGAGERLAALSPLPPLWLVLANPGFPVATPDVFRALQAKGNPPMSATLPQWDDTDAFAGWLRCMRNDLEPAALVIVPRIGAVLAALAALPWCLLARMSGSGATCFGLFAGAVQARTAAEMLAKGQPGWWVRSAPVFAGF